MRLKSKIIVALAAICALGAVPTASAAAAEAHWYVGGVKLAEGIPTPITGTGTGTSELQATIATIHINITCTAMMSSTGEIENPNLGGMGIGEEMSLVFSGCTVDPVAQHCTVKGVTVPDPAGTITTAELEATAETGMKVKFEPEGANFVELELFGCATGGLNRVYPVTGAVTGVEAGTRSGMLTFAAATGLKLGGIAAVFTNTTDLTAGGAAVTIEEP